MSTPKTATRWVVRGGVTLVAVVVTVATLGAAHAIGVPGVTGEPAGRTVTPVPADAQRVCAGGALRLSDASGADATRATRVGRQTVAAAASAGGVQRSTLDASTSGGSDPTVITAPAGDSSRQVAGSGIQDVSSDDMVGLGAASCDDPATSTWLVGGSTETGRTSLITLSNPTQVNATVDLDVYDASGTVRAPGTTGIVVAPGSQKVVPLSGFVSDQGSTTVHVTSSGGQIVAAMQESVVRTLTPGGYDVVQGGAEPSTTQVIPGVVLRDAAAAQSGEDTTDAQPVLRLFVPGTKAARVTLSIATADGGGASVNATAEPGVVTDVPLDSFPDGVYSMTVSSSVPLVAGARSTATTSGSRTDLGWFASATPLSGTVLTDVVDGPGTKLTLVNPTRDDATVTLETSDGKKRDVDVASGATATTDVPTSRAVRISGADGLSLGVTYSGGSGISGFPIRPSTEVSSPVRVSP